MGKVTPLISSFSSGEWSPRLFGRVDVAKYFSGAEELKNILVDQYGGAFRRPGSYFVIETLDSSKKSRLLSFQFSKIQAYIIEAGDQYMRFFKDNGSILETAKNITAATNANPTVITSASHGFSNGDVVYITGVGGMTDLNGRFFTVAGATTNTFQLSGVNSTSYGTYTSGGTVSRVYKISTPYLEADLFKVQNAQSADIMYLTHNSYAPRKLTRTGHTSWTLTEIEFTNGPYLDTNTSATTITPSADTVGSGRTLTASSAIFQAGHVGSLWRIKDGYVKVTGFTSTTVVTVDVKVALGTGPAATTDWAEGAWSAVRGYPSCVTFYGQRLWFAATTHQPQSLWGSKVASFEDFTPGVDDADPISVTILSEQVNAIKWLSPQNKLIIGTQGGDFDLSSGSFGEPVTPTNVTINGGTTYGSAEVLPKRIGSFIYYMQRNTRTVRELSYDVNIDNRQAYDMTLLAEHITESGIVEIDYSQSPNNVLWCVRADGQIATLTRQVDQEVIAWTRQVTDGKYESVSIIPAVDPTYDEVWTIVNRTINGQTKRYVEYFGPPDFTDQEDCHFVDCGLVYDGAAATLMRPLHHLEAKSVQILVDGAVAPNQNVSNGQLTLVNAGEKVHIGLASQCKITTLRQEGGSPLGTSQGKVKCIYEIVIRFHKTLGCKVGNKTQQDTVVFRTAAMPMDAPPELYSGDKTISPPSGYDQDGQICIIQDQPLPLGVLAIFPKISMGED